MRMKKIMRIITPVLSAILGIIVANNINIFALLSLVPQEYAYEICITVYISIANIVIELLLNKILLYVNDRFLSCIEVIISPIQTNANIDSNIELEFGDDGLAQAKVTVIMKGRRKHFRNIELIINRPAFAEVQFNQISSEVKMAQGNCYIKLEELFGNDEIIDSNRNFRIVFIKDPIDGDNSIIVTPKLSRKRWHLLYKNNSLKLKAVKR